MIFAQHDLAVDEYEVEEIINDPYLYPYELHVDCSKIGYTTITISASKLDEPRDLVKKRSFKRFLLFNGVNDELDDLMNDRNNFIINRYVFITEQGTIIVVDYERDEE